MHPQPVWMMRNYAEQLQREVEQNMRMRAARDAARQNRPGRIAGLRHACGAALIAVGHRIQPAERPIGERDAAVELELAR